MAKPKNKRKHKPTRKTADKYDLYQKAVQEPTFEVEFFDKQYHKRFGRKPVLLREDFCGTAQVCAEWVKSKKDRRAVGVDLDPEPLQWYRQNIEPTLKPDQAERVTLLETDVRTLAEEGADVLAAQNFSFFLFKTREALRDYFQYALDNLASEGMMVLDMMGGSEVMLEDHKDETKKEGFTYIWEQKRFDPTTHDAKFAIHFKFKDGTKWKNAFEYDWRIWTIPEVRELLVEAGFSKVDVLWEGTDEDGEGDSDFKIRKHVPADPAWIAYIIAEK
jgi:hypothetical protein